MATMLDAVTDEETHFSSIGRMSSRLPEGAVDLTSSRKYRRCRRLRWLCHRMKHKYRRKHYHNEPKSTDGLHSIELSGKVITCKIEKVVREDCFRYHPNPFMYKIQLSLNEQVHWTVYRTYNELAILFELMFMANAREKLKRRAQRSLDTSVFSTTDRLKPRTIPATTIASVVPKENAMAAAHLLLKPVIVLNEEEAVRKSYALISRLQEVLNDPAMISRPDCLRFIEVSMYSFNSLTPVTSIINDQHQLIYLKPKEGTVRKRSGGYRRLTLRSLYKFVFRWRTCWLIVNDNFLAYAHPKSGEIRGVLLFDDQIQIEPNMGLNKVHRPGIVIKNSSRSLTISCHNQSRCKDFEDSIRKAVEQCTYCDRNLLRFNSFAPPRQNAKVKWLVDGAAYFETIAHLIMEATKEIFITDWFLSPEIHLKRPPMDNEWRLDTLLKKKAKQGVRIYILLYKEVDFVLGTNSAYSKKKLMDSHDNIRVLRYPDHRNIVYSTLLWANHEKILVIDQCVAFFGGFDICYGRWDDCSHRLADLGMPAASDLHTDSVTASTRGVVVHSVAKESSTKNNLKLKNVPASFSDVKLHRKDISTFLKDTLPDYKNMTKSNILAADSSTTSCLQAKLDESDETRRRTISVVSDSTLRSDSQKSSAVLISATSNLIRGSSLCHSLDSGIAYLSIAESIHKLDDCVRLSIRRRIRDKLKYIPRLSFLSSSTTSPCHETEDNDCAEKKHPDNAQRSSLHKIKVMEKNLTAFGEMIHDKLVHPNGLRLWLGKDYSNILLKDFKSVDMPFEDSIDRSTLPRMPWHDVGGVVSGEPAQDIARHFIQRWNFVKVIKFKKESFYPFLLPKTNNSHHSLIDIEELHPNKCNVQVLRSIGSWAAGINRVESSIASAYLKAIEEAKYYIYIENQFFISESSTGVVKNRVADALFKRIERAHQCQQCFRVYVILPLMPGFEGEYGTNSGAAINAITHWNYRSISHGSQSLIGRISALGCDPLLYINFCSLRNWARLNERLVTEMIYVHSKVMIVDDRLVICGSANLNDRSLCGNRDSEIALHIEDAQFILGKMNGQTVQVGKFAYSLRCRLMKEHIGILFEERQIVDLRDPISDKFYRDIWLATAAKNTIIYEKVFNCIPSDRIQDLNQLRKAQSMTCFSSTDPEAAIKILKKIQGFLVMTPLKFFQKQRLLPRIPAKESLIPAYLWT